MEIKEQSVTFKLPGEFKEKDFEFARIPEPAK